MRGGRTDGTQYLTQTLNLTHNDKNNNGFLTEVSLKELRAHSKEAADAIQVLMTLPSLWDLELII